MDKQSNNNINEIKLLVLQLAQQFNKKFDEQARVILDQRNQLDEQQQQIHNQRAIIEELAWQIRDLRDSVRKYSEKVISNVHSNHHTSTTTTNTLTAVKSNSPAENHLKLIIPEANLARQSNHRAEFSPIYESINFDVAAANRIIFANNNNINKNQQTITAATDANAKNIQPANPLERQNAFDSIDGVDNVVKRKQSTERDVQDFLERCIPPPPVTSPPHDTDSETDDPVQISHQTLEKLNSLYSLYKWRQSSSTSETNETIAAPDNVVLRLREFDDCSARLFRGSSKAMCSLVSNVEDDYLPRMNGAKNGDEHGDGAGDIERNDNEFINSTGNEFIGKHSNDAHSQKQQKPIYTQNDEVYI